MSNQEPNSKPTTPEQPTSKGSSVQRLVGQVFASLDADIADRCGIKHEWRKIDADVMDNDIRKEWEGIIGSALRLIEDSYALALAQHVPIALWPDTIGAARKLMDDPEEWKRLGQAVPTAFNLPNADGLGRRTLDADSK